MLKFAGPIRNREQVRKNMDLVDGLAVLILLNSKDVMRFQGLSSIYS